ncbi:PREDICTED: rRNA methyltransferase 3, mitochondrial [Eufriesea mexicana]|uniref:rRNA methyltransferase 3, mitochondrial n=1 Tax=Eufriesea mexicana TaxID=516756 RepID=UPI00083C74DE|nr:PREDICTED: rRNA methyltransferase 3, mitochondrial [Eufriesea mexicana]
MVFFNVIHNTIRPLRYIKTLPTVNLTITRTYARWVSRKPVAIVNEDKLYDYEDTNKPQIPQQKTFPRKKSRETKQKISQKTESENTQMTVKSNISTKLWKNNSIVTSLLSKLKSRKKAEKANEIILEGHRLIKDALKFGLIPSAIIFNDSLDIEQLELPEGVPLYKVPYKTIQLWSSVVNSPGLLGIFKSYDIYKKTAAKNALPLTIICDNVRDPGNLGSIMRVAAAASCEKLILIKGCVDLWDPKVLRSAAGTHFHLPIRSFLTWDEVPPLIEEDSHIFIADCNFSDKYLFNYSPDVLHPSLKIFDIDPEDIKTKFFPNNDETRKKTESEIPTTKKVLEQFMLNLPIIPYHSIDYTKKESVIVISGETVGLSLNCYNFLKERKSIRIHISIEKEVNSLNVGVALGILIFEIKRQFLKKDSFC